MMTSLIRLSPLPVSAHGARRCLCRLSALFALVCGPPASAQSDFFLSGFASQGYLNSTGNDYLIQGSKQGSAEFNEVGLVFYATPAEHLRIGIQFLARDFGQIANNQVLLDWGFGDYRWRDYLGVRAGKVRTPFGFYNQIRDVDIARDQIFLPQSVYDERLRDFFLAYEGASVYGSLRLGESGGTLDYETWGGTFNVPDVTRGFWADIWRGIGRELVPDLIAQFDVDQASIDVDFRTVTDSRVTFPWGYGGSLVWNTPVDGFRVGATALHTRVEAQAALVYDIALFFEDPNIPPEFLRSDLPHSLEFDVGPLSTASAEYYTDKWTFASEFQVQSINDTHGIGWYGLASYRVFDGLALTANYGEFYPDASDKDGTNQAIAAAAWQKDLSVGFRYDITSNWLIKYEHHFVDGLALIDKVSNLDANPNDFRVKWSYLSAKTSFHF